MLTTDTSDAVVQKVIQALERNRAICFWDESPDNEYPSVKWRSFGLIDTNEVATIVRCGGLKIGACRESYLLYPAMAERVFGVDVSDYQLAFELADEIWEKHRERLIAEARK